MKHIITAKEAHEMATNNEEKFINSGTARKILRKVKKRATLGYLETEWIEVFKTERHLAQMAFSKLGYLVHTDHDGIYDRYYIKLYWNKV
jgi:predicted RNA-binding protein associated with RNAse of E/G family